MKEEVGVRRIYETEIDIEEVCCQFFEINTSLRLFKGIVLKKNLYIITRQKNLLHRQRNPYEAWSMGYCL